MPGGTPASAIGSLMTRDIFCDPCAPAASTHHSLECILSINALHYRSSEQELAAMSQPRAGRYHSRVFPYSFYCTVLDTHLRVATVLYWRTSVNERDDPGHLADAKAFCLELIRLQDDDLWNDLRLQSPTQLLCCIECTASGQRCISVASLSHRQRTWSWLESILRHPGGQCRMASPFFMAPFKAAIEEDYDTRRRGTRETTFETQLLRRWQANHPIVLPGDSWHTVVAAVNGKAPPPDSCFLGLICKIEYPALLQYPPREECTTAMGSLS